MVARVGAPRKLVWDTLVDIERQPVWMRDALDVQLQGSEPLGAGSRLRVPTRLGPLKTIDELEVTAFEPPQHWAVKHDSSLVRGTGEFVLVESETGDATEVHWSQHFEAPLGLLGEFALTALEPFVRRALANDLERLKRLCEAEARRLP